jgi:uncharacterized protein (DUF608 family)
MAFDPLKGYNDGFFSYEIKIEINELVNDLKFCIENLFYQPWATLDLEKAKEIAEKIIEQSKLLQKQSSAFSHEYEVLNRIQDKISDYVINPILGLLSPGSTECTPKELWGAIESAFFGPRSIYQELKALNER